jgi:hypothetical protein
MEPPRNPGRFNPPAGQVDDGGQVGEAGPRPHVRDVADVAGVHLRRGPEVAIDEVQRLVLVGPRDGGRAPAAPAPALQAGGAHEPGHPAPATGDPLVGQFGLHPGRAVGAVGDLVDLGDDLGQLGIGAGPGAGRGLEGLVVGGFGDLEQRTGPGHPALPRLFRLEEGTGLHRVSFAKKAVALFSISTSSRSRRFSAAGWTALPSRRW